MTDRRDTDGLANRVKGAGKELEGKVRGALGDLTDNESEQVKGKAQELKGKAQQKLGEAQDRLADERARNRELDRTLDETDRI